MSDRTTTLVLLCKRPAPGIGKQRLVARLGSEVAQQVASALLTCAMEDACQWEGPVVIAPASMTDIEWAHSLTVSIPSPVKIVPQEEGNLGQRLNALDRTLRAQGMERLVFIGSDAPGLNAVTYAAVCGQLQNHDVVLIPSVDGGVVLMANRLVWPDLSGLPWSSDRLGASLAETCRNAGHTVKTLGQGYDVDEPDDVMELIILLQQDQRPARRILLELAKDIASTLKTNA